MRFLALIFEFLQYQLIVENPDGSRYQMKNENFEQSIDSFYGNDQQNKNHFEPKFGGGPDSQNGSQPTFRKRREISKNGEPEAKISRRSEKNCIPTDPKGQGRPNSLYSSAKQESKRNSTAKLKKEEEPEEDEDLPLLDPNPQEMDWQFESNGKQNGTSAVPSSNGRTSRRLFYEDDSGGSDAATAGSPGNQDESSPLPKSRWFESSFSADRSPPQESHEEPTIEVHLSPRYREDGEQVMIKVRTVRVFVHEDPKVKKNSIKIPVPESHPDSGTYLSPKRRFRALTRAEIDASIEALPYKSPKRFGPRLKTLPAAAAPSESLDSSLKPSTCRTLRAVPSRQCTPPSLP